MSTRAIRHLVIRGRVQGVGYRAFAEYTALDHGLAGWVRNRRDGAVEVVVAGPPSAMVQMIDYCRSGPPLARVESIEIEDAAALDLGHRRPGEAFSLIATQ